MRAMRTAEDHVQFMLDLANMDLKNPETFTTADLEVLREEFCRYLGYARNEDGSMSPSIDYSIRGWGSRITKEPFPFEFKKEDFLALQNKLVTHLHERRDYQDAYKKGEKEVFRVAERIPEPVDYTLSFSFSGLFVEGDAIDVALYHLVTLRDQYIDILRCPNWKSKLCPRKFFVKVGKSVYCSLRCGNAYRVRKHFKLSKRRKAKVLKLAQRKLTRREISAKLGIDVDFVNRTLKEQPASATRRGKTKRGK